jgi:DNA-binding GntR family transcriptional regulator
MIEAPTRPAQPSLRAQAYASFQRQIVASVIVPGQFVSQRELMQLLDMPLGAVRELIPRLEAEGLLRTVPQRGLQVAHVDLKLINNAFHLRRMLEREAAGRFVVAASDADLAAIEQAHVRIVERASQGRIDDELLADAMTVDWSLHDLMIESLGNELISEVHRINSLRVRLIKFEGPTRSATVLTAAMQEHLWIIQALKQRDTRTVVERIEYHIDSAHRRALGLPRTEAPWQHGMAGVAATGAAAGAGLMLHQAAPARPAAQAAQAT